MWAARRRGRTECETEAAHRNCKPWRLSMDLLLKDKVVVVAGSSAGIGLATAKEFAREGAYVTLCGRDPGRLQAAAAEMPAGAAPALTVSCDLMQAEGAEAVIAATVKAHGGIDVLVNNVGGAV